MDSFSSHVVKKGSISMNHVFKKGSILWVMLKKGSTLRVMSKKGQSFLSDIVEKASIPWSKFKKFHLPIHKSFKSWSQRIFKKGSILCVMKKEGSILSCSKKCSILSHMWEKTILWVISINKKSSILWVVFWKRFNLLES